MSQAAQIVKLTRILKLINTFYKNIYKNKFNRMNQTLKMIKFSQTTYLSKYYILPIWWEVTNFSIYQSLNFSKYLDFPHDLFTLFTQTSQVVHLI